MRWADLTGTRPRDLRPKLAGAICVADGKLQGVPFEIADQVMSGIQPAMNTPAGEEDEEGWEGRDIG